MESCQATTSMFWTWLVEGACLGGTHILMALNGMAIMNMDMNQQSSLRICCAKWSATALSMHEYMHYPADVLCIGDFTRYALGISVSQQLYT